MHTSKKPIRFWSAVSMGIGAMVGAGIFALSGEARAISGSLALMANTIDSATESFASLALRDELFWRQCYQATMDFFQIAMQ